MMATKCKSVQSHEIINISQDYVTSSPRELPESQNAFALVETQPPIGTAATSRVEDSYKNQAQHQKSPSGSVATTRVEDSYKDKVEIPESIPHQSRQYEEFDNDLYIITPERASQRQASARSTQTRADIPGTIPESQIGAGLLPQLQEDGVPEGSQTKRTTSNLRAVAQQALASETSPQLRVQTHFDRQPAARTSSKTSVQSKTSTRAPSATSQTSAAPTSVAKKATDKAEMAGTRTADLLRARQGRGAGVTQASTGPGNTPKTRTAGAPVSLTKSAIPTAGSSKQSTRATSQVATTGMSKSKGKEASHVVAPAAAGPATRSTRRGRTPVETPPVSRPEGTTAHDLDTDDGLGPSKNDQASKVKRGGKKRSTASTATMKTKGANGPFHLHEDGDAGKDFDIPTSSPKAHAITRKQPLRRSPRNQKQRADTEQQGSITIAGKLPKTRSSQVMEAHGEAILEPAKPKATIPRRKADTSSELEPAEFSQPSPTENEASSLKMRPANGVESLNTGQNAARTGHEPSDDGQSPIGPGRRRAVGSPFNGHGTQQNPQAISDDQDSSPAIPEQVSHRKGKANVPKPNPPKTPIAYPSSPPVPTQYVAEGVAGSEHRNTRSHKTTIVAFDKSGPRNQGKLPDNTPAAKSARSSIPPLNEHPTSSKTPVSTVTAASKRRSKGPPSMGTSVRIAHIPQKPKESNSAANVGDALEVFFGKRINTASQSDGAPMKRLTQQDNAQEVLAEPMDELVAYGEGDSDCRDDQVDPAEMKQQTTSSEGTRLKRSLANNRNVRETQADLTNRSSPEDHIRQHMGLGHDEFTHQQNLSSTSPRAIRQSACSRGDKTASKTKSFPPLAGPPTEKRVTGHGYKGTGQADDEDALEATHDQGTAIKQLPELDKTTGHKPYNAKNVEDRPERSRPQESNGTAITVDSQDGKASRDGRELIMPKTERTRREVIATERRQRSPVAVEPETLTDEFDGNTVVDTTETTQNASCRKAKSKAIASELVAPPTHNDAAIRTVGQTSKPQPKHKPLEKGRNSQESRKLPDRSSVDRMPPPPPPRNKVPTATQSTRSPVVPVEKTAASSRPKRGAATRTADPVTKRVDTPALTVAAKDVVPHPVNMRASRKRSGDEADIEEQPAAKRRVKKVNRQASQGSQTVDLHGSPVPKNMEVAETATVLETFSQNARLSSDNAPTDPRRRRKETPYRDNEESSEEDPYIAPPSHQQEVMSSNTKPIPAEPDAESTAFSKVKVTETESRLLYGKVKSKRETEDPFNNSGETLRDEHDSQDDNLIRVAPELQSLNDMHARAKQQKEEKAKGEMASQISIKGLRRRAKESLSPRVANLYAGVGKRTHAVGASPFAKRIGRSMEKLVEYTGRRAKEEEDPDKTLVNDDDSGSEAALQKSPHLAVIDSGSQSDTEDLIAWTGLLKPHQRSLFDELVKCAQRLTTIMVEEENGTEQMLEEYHRRNMYLIQQEEKRQVRAYQDLLAMRKQKRKEKNARLIKLSKNVRSLARDHNVDLNEHKAKKAAWHSYNRELEEFIDDLE